MKVGPPAAETMRHGRADRLDAGCSRAKFFVVWQVVTVVDLSVTFFMSSLAVGVAREPGRAVGQPPAHARLQLISTVAVIVVVGAADVAALLPVAYGYIAVQVVCAAAVLLAPARRRPADVEVVSP